MFHGGGDYIWPDGRSYTGQWERSRMSGQGVFEWPDGCRYDGRYRGDKKHGQGVFRWSDNSTSSGLWCNGKPHGVALHTTAVGVCRRVGWNHGEFESYLDADPCLGEGEEASLAASPAASPVVPSEFAEEFEEADERQVGLHGFWALGSPTVLEEE
eukprot:NODE_5417_length_583_cov_287.918561.p2 GENE.NODE_5417_length_583_cov_287.918561~~NODE_5417_length_583_cov_287.918561.p2  ORF type:complete len:165 (+),score=36.20 NODE_5417_length_583_cov_287.918561:28-495(+)